MSTEVAVTLSQLQQLVDDVTKTKHARTIRLADGVVAVVKPERKPVARRPVPMSTRAATRSTTPSSVVASLAGAAGTLPRPVSWHEMQEIAWEDHVREKYEHRS